MIAPVNDAAAPTVTGSAPIRILIVEDHPVVRQGVRQIVGSNVDMKVVAEAADGREALGAAEQVNPDLVLLDLSLPGMDGIDVLKGLKRVLPRTPVIVLTMHSEEEFAIRAVKAGASGYLTKDTAPAELVSAVRRVYGGGRYVSAWLAERLTDRLSRGSERPAHERLSDREYQVLRLIASGKSTREISEILSLSVKTVSTYRARIFHKMGVRTPAALVAYVIRNGLSE
jgi:DNA-binding NarL/FixJ family response regulator